MSFFIISGQGYTAVDSTQSTQGPGVMLSLGDTEAAMNRSALSPFHKSSAYQRYQRGPKTNLAKLMYLMNRLKESAYKIIYNGREYEPHFVGLLVTQYVMINYKKETVEDWIDAHAYRSRSKGKVIYLQSPDGDRRILRDVLLEELEALPQDPSQAKAA